MSDFAQNLESQIRRHYEEAGYRLGWRLLYSPRDVLDGANVAFIGLNPGGKVVRRDHAEFATARGSAYADEVWKQGRAPGESPLQRQVLALFEMLGEPPDRVLAGNLVPFRSPSWNRLPAARDALEFGTEIWREILGRASPRLVVAMGGEAHRAMIGILGVPETERIPVNWGNVSGEMGDFPGGKLVRLPHLSRFGIATREQSRPALTRLLR